MVWPQIDRAVHWPAAAARVRVIKTSRMAHESGATSSVLALYLMNQKQKCFLPVPGSAADFHNGI